MFVSHGKYSELSFSNGPHFIWSVLQNCDLNSLPYGPGYNLIRAFVRCHWVTMGPDRLYNRKSDWSRASFRIDLLVFVYSHEKTGQQVQVLLLIWTLWKHSMKSMNTLKTIFCENLHENVPKIFWNAQKIFGKVENCQKPNLLTAASNKLLYLLNRVWFWSCKI